MRKCRPPFRLRPMTTPFTNLVHYPTNTDAELDRLQQLCEQLAGFDERVSLEWLDGAMTALAAGPRAKPLVEWRDALLGDAWSRAFADPQADREATAVLTSRWNGAVEAARPRAADGRRRRAAPGAGDARVDGRRQGQVWSRTARSRPAPRTTRSRSPARSGRTASWTPCRQFPAHWPEPDASIEDRDGRGLRRAASRASRC